MSNSLSQELKKLESQEQEIAFSEEIRSQLASVNKTIEALTKDQFQVINWLRDKKRAAISGCAGSGKTLVATEKAIRLSSRGIKCSDIMSQSKLAYIETLAPNTDIKVADFSNWIKIP